MKKAKHLQRFWAFLLAFVLVSTTIASDGMSIVAAEGETTTEQTVSDPKTAEQTSNKGGSAFTAETEQQGETPQVEEGSKAETPLAAAVRAQPKKVLWNRNPVRKQEQVGNRLVQKILLQLKKEQKKLRQR